MSHSSASAALDAFLLPRRTALRCVANTALPAGAARRAGSDEWTIEPTEGPLQLRGPLRLQLLARWRVRVNSTAPHVWDITETEYIYEFDDADGREYLSYHWHPTTEAVTFPHLHLGPAIGALRREPSRAHLPTGV